MKDKYKYGHENGMVTTVPTKFVPVSEPDRKPIYQFECLYGPHQAELLHRGTAYCRACYDQRNPYGKLIDN